MSPLISGGLAIAIMALILVMLLALLAALMPFAWMRRLAGDRTIESLEAMPDGSRIVVLGCPTRSTSGEPNRYFVARIATAAAAYHHLDPHSGRGTSEGIEILCSGWDERGEATDMATALVAARVDRGAITVDGRAARTIDTIELVASRFPSERIVFVSQRFHIPRVLYLAREHGLDAWGLPAEGSLQGARPRIREALATHRAIFDHWRRRSKSPSAMACSDDPPHSTHEDGPP